MIRYDTVSICKCLFKPAGMDRSVMQLRAEVGALLGRCVDEVKLIAFQRQLEVSCHPVFWVVSMSQLQDSLVDLEIELRIMDFYGFPWGGFLWILMNSYGFLNCQKNGTS